MVETQARARVQRLDNRAALFAGGLAVVSLYYLAEHRQLHADSPDESITPRFEQIKTKRGTTKEAYRDLVSSQHTQVKRSWENPGVYAWGSNTSRVVAPDSDQPYVKVPRRITFFDGKLLRDLKLDKSSGAAIDENGNLLQWGLGYSSSNAQPVITLAGKNLTALSLSRDRVLALSASGHVYSIPVDAEEQKTGVRQDESTWVPFWSFKAAISYRRLTPPNLAWNEKVTTVSSGLDHTLMLTNKGRIFSAASATETYPSRGQLGIPGLTWQSKPNGPYDMPHEITTLRGFDIDKIACGDYHSLVADKDGRVFAFGDNTSGQLGFEYSADSSIIDAPSLLPLQKLYPGSQSQTSTRITSLAAGGNTSYMTIDATKASRMAPVGDVIPRTRVTADTWTFGSGIYGSLGTGRWTHVQGTPTKIPTLSGLFEYDEQRNETIPIRLAKLSVGSTHAAAIMRNVTYLDAPSSPTSARSTSDDELDTNWGADIVFWGGNEHFQIGNGKRNNINAPMYIKPLDAVAEAARSDISSSGGRKPKEGEHRFQITPRKTVRLGDGRTVSVEQTVECGRGCTAVYSKA